MLHYAVTLNFLSPINQKSVNIYELIVLPFEKEMCVHFLILIEMLTSHGSFSEVNFLREISYR